MLVRVGHQDVPEEGAAGGEDHFVGLQLLAFAAGQGHIGENLVPQQVLEGFHCGLLVVLPGKVQQLRLFRLHPDLLNTGSEKRKRTLKFVILTVFRSSLLQGLAYNYQLSVFNLFLVIQGAKVKAYRYRQLLNLWSKHITFSLITI